MCNIKNSSVAKAIVLGGGNDQISLFNELRKRFPHVHILLIDYLENPPAKSFADIHIRESSLDIDAVYNIAEREGIDLIITACTDQALLTMANVSEKLGLKCYLTHEQARSFTNKLYMKKMMLDNGIPTSKYQIIKSKNESVMADLTYPLIVKPVDNNSSKGISKITTPSQIASALEKAFRNSRSEKVIIEEFKEGCEYSVDAIIIEGDPVPIFFSKYKKYKVINQGLTVVQNSYDDTLSPFLKKQITEIIRAIGVGFKIENTPIFMQFISDGVDVNVIEFSARTGGGSKHHLIQAVTGINMVRALLDITFCKVPPLNIKNNSKYALMNFVYAKPGTFCGLHNFSEFKSREIIHDYFVYKALGAKVEHIRSSTDRVAGISILDNNINSLKNKINIINRDLEVLNEMDEDIMIHGLYECLYD